MSDGDLRSLRFRREREVTWRQLETILERVEKNSVNSLSRDELLEAPALYRATLSSLSVARATSLDQALITYLESLCTRAYFFVYGPRTTLLAQAASFFARDWPAAVRAQVWPTVSAALILIVAGVCAFLLVQTDPAYFYSFIRMWTRARRWASSPPSCSTTTRRWRFWRSRWGSRCAFPAWR